MNFISTFTKKWTQFANWLREKNILKACSITSKVVWNLLLILIVLTLMGGFFATGVGAGYFASLVKDEPIRPYENMEKDIYNYEENSEVYFRDNKYMMKLRSDLEREEVELSEISMHVQEAVISTEDQYFYEHDGIVPKAIMRAIVQEVTNSPVQTGGSTLTQQLIKNQILTNEVSFDRKAKEMLLALRLERFFDKDEILEAYLNVVPFGRNSSGKNIAGIQAAAQGIFGVDAKDLNLPQSAFIAGLPKNPFGYTPFTNTREVKEDIEPALNRMKVVLSRMRAVDFISEEEYEEALAYDIKGNFTPPLDNSFEKRPSLTMEIERRAIQVMSEQMAEDAGKKYEELTSTERKETRALAERKLRQQGYKIHTTIDQGLHDAMNGAKDNVEYGPNHYVPELDKTLPVEVGSILIKNDTGAILGFVGGRDYNRESINHATQTLRHSGSTNKPLAVYAPAMEAGIIQPGSIIPDTPFTHYFGSGSWPVHNYGGGYHGLVTARKALKYSYNIPAARTFVKLNGDKVSNYFQKMGFTSLTEMDPYNPAFSLGSMSSGVSVEENTNAFATFANSGKFIDSYMIEKIETQDGDVIYQHEVKPVEVFSPQTAYLMLDMMRDVVKSGTAAGIPGLTKFYADWAGKTGTSQDYRDAWFIATNPNVTLGTWIGYDTQLLGLKDGAGGYESYSRRNQKAWAAFANAAYDVNPELVAPNAPFQSPGGIVRRSFCAISGKLPSDLCREAGLVKTDLFNAKYVPTEADDSLQKARYVTVGEEKYKALDSTPAEFTDQGVMIKEDYFKDVNLDSIVQAENIIGEKELKENGKTPGPVQGVSGNGANLTWNKHGEGDVVGYRIYRAPNGTNNFSRIGSVKANKTNMSISQGDFTYIVTAVDIAGNESEQSKKEIVGDPEPNKPKKEDDDNDGNNNDGGNGEDKKDKKDDKKKDDDKKEDNDNNSDENEDGE
jgi:penicillin-binding protein